MNPGDAFNIGDDWLGADVVNAADLTGATTLAQWVCPRPDWGCLGPGLWAMCQHTRACRCARAYLIASLSQCYADGTARGADFPDDFITASLAAFSGRDEDLDDADLQVSSCNA